MSTRRGLIVILLSSVIVLGGSIGSSSVGQAHGVPPTKGLGTTGMTISYPGRLSDQAGQPIADGAYDFVFRLCDGETGGRLLWTEAQAGVMVKAGTFAALPGSVNPIPAEALDGDPRWLAVKVRGPGESHFTSLTPRQRLSSPLGAEQEIVAAAPLNCPHDHLGEFWNGYGTGNLIGLGVSSDGGTALSGWSNGDVGVMGIGMSITGSVTLPTGRIGVVGSGEAHRVYGSGGTTGMYTRSDTGTGIFVAHAAKNAIHVDSADWAGLYVESAGQDAIRVNSAGWTGVYVADSDYDAIRVEKAGVDGLRFLAGVGRDYIRAGNDGDEHFRVRGSDGAVFSDGGYHAPADFAELVRTEGSATAYEPGDVLVISAETDRTVALSSEPYSKAVVGVHSEKPGFVGSPHVVEEQRDDEIPVAVMGIVPVKVSSENGPVKRGDLLVTSSTPSHAMRADDPPPGTILGKALEAPDEDTGVIQMLVTLHWEVES